MWDPSIWSWNRKKINGKPGEVRIKCVVPLMILYQFFFFLLSFLPFFLLFSGIFLFFSFLLNSNSTVILYYIWGARLITFNILMFFYNTDQETLLNYIQHYLLFKQNILKEKNYNIKLSPLLEVKEKLWSLRERERNDLKFLNFYKMCQIFDTQKKLNTSY
jgi:hypothetical protein